MNSPVVSIKQEVCVRTQRSKSDAARLRIVCAALTGVLASHPQYIDPDLAVDLAMNITVEAVKAFELEPGGGDA